MSIESKISPSGQTPEGKKPWITPSIQILDLNQALGGLLKNGHDRFTRS